MSVSAGLWLEYIKGFWIEEGVGGGVAGGRRSASSQTDDPADRLTFCGGFNSWGGGGSAADQPGGEPRRRGGMKAELEGVKFSAEKVKNKSKGESKVETGRRRDEAVTTADLDSTLVGCFFFVFFRPRSPPVLAPGSGSKQ